MAKWIGLDNESAKRLSNVVRTVERVGVHVPPPYRTIHEKDYPVPVHVGKASEAIASGESGAAVLWGTSFLSTAADASLGTSVTARSWGGSIASSGDEIFMFRSRQNGLFYFISALNKCEACSTTMEFPVLTCSSDNEITCVDLGSSDVTGYSTAVTEQYLARSSTGVYWASPSTCA